MSTKTGKVVSNFKDDKGNMNTVLERSADNLEKNPDKQRFFVVVHDGTKVVKKGNNQTFFDVETARNKYVNSKGEQMETYFKPIESLPKEKTVSVNSEGETTEVTDDFTPSPISEFSAAVVVERAWGMAATFANPREEKDTFLKIARQLEFDMVKEICHVMRKCEIGEPNFFK